MNSAPMGMLPPNGNALGFMSTLEQAERLMADNPALNSLCPAVAESYSLFVLYSMHMYIFMRSSAFY